MSRRAWVLGLCVPLGLAACGGDASDEVAVIETTASAPATPPRIVEISGMDYAFVAPVEIPAGLTTIRFANQGSELHHLTLYQLAEGHTVDEVVTALAANQPLGGIATAVGGPNAPVPGEHSNATVDLAPGRYAAVCVIPAPDGVPHMMKGMAREILVTGAAAPAVEPTSDARIALMDYGFTVDGDLAAGNRTIRVENGRAATEAHEVVLVRLAPGATVGDVNDWIHAMEGPPPGEPIGGVTALAPGMSNSFEVELTPGEYGLLCPLPSVRDGESHSYKGMMHQFTVS